MSSYPLECVLISCQTEAKLDIFCELTMHFPRQYRKRFKKPKRPLINIKGKVSENGTFVGVNNDGVVVGTGGAGTSIDCGKNVPMPNDYHGTGYQPVWPSSHMPVFQSFVFLGWIRGRVVAREVTALPTFPIAESNRFRCTWFCELSKSEEGTASINTSITSLARGGQFQYQTL
ncbi:hypothetical protein BGX38DRAFT_748165 [Terfezia claveryi]|nr:hypothetical protein BGX38DRAFT_748165 [Terfezia claveryi]